AVVEAALTQLEQRRQEVNDLNVFPVADGDTGDNMVLTLRAVLAELDRLSGDGARTIDEIGREEIVESVARAALLGARGNSGVILSQLIRGAAEELASRAGVVAALRGAEAPELEHHRPPARVTHPQHESTTYRYCTNFAVTGDDLDAAGFIRRLEEIGDSVLVVGDRATLKVHVHTDEPEH